MELTGYGITVDLPSGWEGRIYKRPEGDPTLHAGNFPLPVEDGDFGSRSLNAMGNAGAFLVVTEYDHALAARGLFSTEAPAPLPTTSELSSSALQRTRPGQLGIQRFMTIGDRPFCVYVVVGTEPSPRRLLAEANQVLRSLLVAAAGPGHAPVSAFHPPSIETRNGDTGFRRIL